MRARRRVRRDAADVESVEIDIHEIKSNRTEPNRTEPNRTEPNRTEPNRTEPPLDRMRAGGGVARRARATEGSSRRRSA
jgi:hypothetical protein